MTKWVIDRIEEDFAVLENIKSRESLLYSTDNLPPGIKEGSALIFNGQHFLPDTSEEAAARSRRIQEKMERLKRKK